MLAGFIIFAIFAGLLAPFMFKGVARGAYKLFASEYRREEVTDENTGTLRLVAKLAIVGFTVGAALFVVGSSLHFVPAGRAGLVTRFGAVTGRTIDPGPNLTLPFIDSVVLYDTRVQKVLFENLDSASAELQDVKVTGVLNYRVNPKAVSWLFQNVGSAEVLEEKVLVPALSQNLKSILPTYPILNILENRDTIAEQLTAAMVETFADYRTDDGQPVIFFAPRDLGDAEGATPAASVFLSNVAFTDAFNKAIEEKQTELQKIEKETNILRQREIQAEQEIAKARGEAEANTLLAASLREQGNFILQFKAIEKLAPNIRLLILDADNGLIPILGEDLLTGGGD